MGKASKFFKSFFGFKPPESTHPPPSAPDQPKRRWSFFKSHKDKPLHNHHLSETFDPSLTRPRDTPRHHHFSDLTRDGDGCSANHAIAVAATTAVVVEASEATAHASVEVVGMTSRTTGVNADYGLPGEWAAVKIQSYFRAYLSRKALRALKALVKLQALVRGTLTRKQTADNLRRLQALVRAQARARARRLQMADSPHSITKFASYIHQNGPPTPEKFEHVVRSRVTKQNQPSILKNNGSRMYDEKILEIDTTKSHLRRRNLFQPDQISYSQSQSLTTSRGSTIHPTGLSPSESYEVNSITAQNSPPNYPVGNMSMRVDPFTPTKSDGSRSCVSGQMDHPNYMANTESSRAKVRSLSAPRQRPQIEFSSTTKRYSVYGCGFRGLNLRDSFVSKAYPGSGRLDRLGMPVGFRESDQFSGGYWN